MENKKLPISARLKYVGAGLSCGACVILGIPPLTPPGLLLMGVVMFSCLCAIWFARSLYSSLVRDDGIVAALSLMVGFVGGMSMLMLVLTFQFSQPDIFLTLWVVFGLTGIVAGWTGLEPAYLMMQEIRYNARKRR